MFGSDLVGDVKSVAGEIRDGRRTPAADKLRDDAVLVRQHEGCLPLTAVRLTVSDLDKVSAVVVHPDAVSARR
jgi:hypothetical protein